MQPLYQKVKEHVLAHIRSGDWPAGHRVPSENELVRALDMSRMTINRALRELTDDGVLARVAGVGTFVADRTAHAHPLEIRNIADEIAARGHHHAARVEALGRVRADAALASRFGLPTRSPLFHSAIVHLENGMPVQFEDRWVNPAIAPDYLAVDFATTTPYAYLTRVAPLAEAEHVLRAVMPDDGVRKRLAMGRGEPCLLLRRRTWTAGVVASCADLYYPGSRYELSGRFTP